MGNRVLGWLKDLDRILRGETTHPDVLKKGEIELRAEGLLIVLIAMAMIYGLCMGCFGLLRANYHQLAATTLKVPALFFLTLLITFPSLYVFNALVGSRLNILAVLRLLIASLAVNLAVLASLGPIVAFFAVSTTSYPFMVLLNVVIFSISGILGLRFLLQTLHRLSIVFGRPGPPAVPSENVADEDQPVEAELAEDKFAEDTGALDPVEGYVLGQHVKTIFGCWVVVFGLVGAQMGWVLRPFIGDPNRPFEWFRRRESNFFEAVFQSFVDLFS